MERIVRAVESDPWLWLICAFIGAWMLIGWGRRRLRDYRNRRRRREFDAREMRRWEGHRRSGDDVTRFRDKSST